MSNRYTVKAVGERKVRFRQGIPTQIYRLAAFIALRDSLAASAEKQVIELETMVSAFEEGSVPPLIENRAMVSIYKTKVHEKEG